ncbi:DUF2630 family protein [Streptomyces canus]|uniref:DUF2630 family protein n=1 Tax=Streptomyces TaxID=1883 RepID=UPI00099E788C|nr:MULTISPECIES: DUF2630 family protein [Streptomyces]MDI5913238.1 DUF2630 family protein [Streptomyces sp. 12257]
MDQGQILGRIAEMVEQERKLRDSAQEGQIDTQEEKQRLGELERELDQCWDLLRQRRAKAEFGQDPDEAHVRPASQVENYLS